MLQIYTILFFQIEKKPPKFFSDSLKDDEE